MLAGPVIESVWVLVQGDDRASADLLVDVAEELLQASERDRNRAKRKAREAKR